MALDLAAVVVSAGVFLNPAGDLKLNPTEANDQILEAPTLLRTLCREDGSGMRRPLSARMKIADAVFAKGAATIALLMTLVMIVLTARTHNMRILSQLRSISMRSGPDVKPL